MAKSFVHLHLHTEFSMLDGAARIQEVVATAAADGQPAVGITDHGNMFGAIDLYTEAKAKDIKLIFGCETYVASSDRHDRTNRRNYHLILLAQNRQAERDRIRAEDDRLVNQRTQAEAEFLARELAASRLSLGKIEATLARLEERLERFEDERSGDEDGELTGSSGD